jgi:hypothetical protein
MLGLGACAELLDLPDDPEVRVDGPWRCLQAPAESDSPRQETAIVRVQACNFVSTNCSAPVTGLTASLCDKKDVNCSNPIRSGIRDVNGELMFEVATGGALGTGFDGYIQVSAPMEACTNKSVFGAAGPMLCGLAEACEPSAADGDCMIPTFPRSLLFFNPPVKADVSRPFLLPMIPTGAIPPILEAVGGDNFDPATGFLFITALDCDGNPAPGVTFTMVQNQAAVTPLYIDNGVISKATSQTDESGLGGFVRVPAGFAGVVGLTTPGVALPPQRIGEIGVQVAPFTITYSTLVPAL